MAWNEPGGNDKKDSKDPWNQGGQDGPPDLDEVIQQLQDKLKRLFGKRSGGSGRGSMPVMPSATVGFILLFIGGVIWLGSGIYIIDEGKRGLVLRFGQYHATEFPGLNWRPRFIDTVLKVDISRQRIVEIGYRMSEGGHSPIAQEALMLTEDENIVNIRLAVQYQVADPVKYLFKITHPDNALKQAAESALREVVGRHSMDFILTKGRTQLVQQIQPLMQAILDQYDTGLNVTAVNLQDAQPPEDVQESFADVIKAREDKQRLKNEADAYSKDVIPKARGGAARQLQEADAYQSKVISAAEGEAARFNQVLAAYLLAPEVTRQRLYLETMEQVLAHSNKVLVDLNQSNNLLYLPLDKLLAPSALEEAAKPPALPSYSNANSNSNTGSSSQETAEPKLIPRDSRTRGTR